MTEKTKGALALLGITFLWSLLALLPRYLSTSFAVLQQVYLRFIFASVFIGVFFYRRISLKKIFSLNKRDFLPIFSRAFIYYLLGVSLFTKAIIITKISNVSFIGALPLTAVFGFLLFKEKLNWQKLIIILLSFLGALILAVQDWSNIFMFKLGELLALLSVICVSFGMLIRKWETNKLNNTETSWLVITLAAILVLIASFFTGEGWPLQNWNLGVLGALALGGLFNAILVSLMTFGISRVSAVLANNIFQLEAPLTMFLAMLIFTEFPSGKEVLGAGLIFSAAYFMNQLEAKEA